jgi:hypothetical protein
MKAKVPPDAPLLVEPGSARPEEVAFDAKEPSACVVPAKHTVVS